jgi:hypothetical protein
VISFLISILGRFISSFGVALIDIVSSLDNNVSSAVLVDFFTFVGSPLSRKHSSSKNIFSFFFHRRGAPSTISSMCVDAVTFMNYTPLACTVYMNKEIYCIKND